MSISIKSLSTVVLIFAAGFIAASLLAFLMISRGENASAQVATGLECTVDEGLVKKLYDAVFKRPLDEGGRGYIGQKIGFMIDEMAKSQEHKMYTAMFKSMKALEEAERQPGDMTEADKSKFRNMMDSAMSNITSWSKTLPEQAAAKAVIGPEHAKEALNFAHSIIPEKFREEAKKSFFDPTKLIGAPTDFVIPDQFKLNFADAQARLQEEIQQRVAQETQFRTQIETQYKLRAEQESAFFKQYGQATTQLTAEQQAAFIAQHQQLQTPPPTASPTPAPTPAPTPTPTPTLAP